MQQQLDNRRKTWKPFGNANADYSTSIGDEVFMEMVTNKPEEKPVKPASVKPAEPAVYVPAKKNKNTGGDEAYDPTKLARKTRKITKDRNDNKLIIFNLSTICTENELKVFLTRYAPVKYINFVYNKETNEFKGFAFIETYNKDDAEYILENVNGQPFNHLILKIKKVKPLENKK
jgi:hypothetical protein